MRYPRGVPESLGHSADGDVLHSLDLADTHAAWVESGAVPGR